MLRRTRPEYIRNADLITETGYRHDENQFYDIESFDESQRVYDRSKRRQKLFKSFPKRILIYIIGIFLAMYIAKSVLSGIFFTSKVCKQLIFKSIC